MSTPRLLARKRLHLAAALAVVALAQAGLAAAFAEAISTLVGEAATAEGQGGFPAATLALGIGAAMMAERVTAERFAQSFVTDCREQIFEAVIRNRGTGGEARWLTALVGDLTALRNYAVRGSVKLWTSMLAGIAASLWFLQAAPTMAPALLPFLAGVILIFGTTWLLQRQIARQRDARGRLNRFLIRRVRIELAGAPCPRGHGRKRLSALTDTLRSRIERRALIFGAMELLAALAGGLAAVLLVTHQGKTTATATLVGQISLIGFIASRLLETARALHAQAGGRIALERLSGLLRRAPA